MECALGCRLIDEFLCGPELLQCLYRVLGFYIGHKPFDHGLDTGFPAGIPLSVFFVLTYAFDG
jgi:hypothetical protein